MAARVARPDSGWVTYGLLTGQKGQPSNRAAEQPNEVSSCGLLVLRRRKMQSAPHSLEQPRGSATRVPLPPPVSNCRRWRSVFPECSECVWSSVIGDWSSGSISRSSELTGGWRRTGKNREEFVKENNRERGEEWEIIEAQGRVRDLFNFG